MRSAIQFVVRQSGWAAFFLLLFALMQGWYVCEGLWQGSGLHGYTIQHRGKYGSGYVVSTWTAFILMLAFMGLAGVLLVINRRRRSACHGLKPEAEKSPASRGRKIRTRRHGQKGRGPEPRPHADIL